MTLNQIADEGSAGTWTKTIDTASPAPSAIAARAGRLGVAIRVFLRRLLGGAGDPLAEMAVPYIRIR